MGQTRIVGKVATTITTDAGGVMRVTYHDTDVVTVYPNGRIDLDNGGWFTPTTKVRMNQASAQFGLGFQVFQKDWDWFVDIDGHTLEFGYGQDYPQYEWPKHRKTTITIRNGS